MAKVKVHRNSQIEWKTMRSVAPLEMMDEISETELESSLAYHETGTDNTPQLTELKYLPNAVTDMHSHDIDEIFFVLSGEMGFGSQTLQPGSSVYLAAHTQYAFKAGPQGLHLLLFRPRGGAALIRGGETLHVRRPTKVAA